jgi:hypothetical protein
VRGADDLQPCSGHLQNGDRALVPGGCLHDAGVPVRDPVELDVGGHDQHGAQAPSTVRVVEIARLVHIPASEVLGDPDIALRGRARIDVHGACAHRARSLLCIDVSLQFQHARGAQPGVRQPAVGGFGVVGVEVEQSEALVLVGHRLGVPRVGCGFVHDPE